MGLNFFIPGDFTSLNNYIRAERGNRHGGSRIKKRDTNQVFFEARHLPAVEKYPVRVSFRWICKNRRTDPDNIRFATKYILDGLVKAGVLRDDGWNEIAGFGGDSYEVDPENPGVEVTIEEL